MAEIPGAESRHVEIETADAGRIRLHVAELGSGPPVLMLHGWPEHHGCWREVAPRLAERHRVLCPDLRGFGWSDAPGRGYDPETFAADAVALLDALEIERAFVVGHDWGGFSGFLMALDRPDRIERYLALNTPVPWVRPTPRLMLETWRLWYVVAMATIGEQMLRRNPGFVKGIATRDAVHPGIDDATARSYAERLREPARARASKLLYRQYVRAFRDAGRPSKREQRRLTVPSRLLFGANDAFISTEMTKGWEPYADDLAVEYVPDSGHFIAEEKPALVADRALELFAESVRA
jgi:pimeloyl-ACP methyl ester carboxylesterase